MHKDLLLIELEVLTKVCCCCPKMDANHFLKWVERWAGTKYELILEEGGEVCGISVVKNNLVV